MIRLLYEDIIDFAYIMDAATGAVHFLYWNEKTSLNLTNKIIVNL